MFLRSKCVESCRGEQVGIEGFVGRSMFRGWMEVSLLVRGVEGLGSSSPGWLPDWLAIALLGSPIPHPSCTGAGCTAWLGCSVIYSVGEAAWALLLDKPGTQFPAPFCACTDRRFFFSTTEIITV